MIEVDLKEGGAEVGRLVIAANDDGTGTVTVWRVGPGPEQYRRTTIGDGDVWDRVRRALEAFT